MSKPVQINPLLRWAGGKRRLVKKLMELSPEGFDRYVEPFAGGAALFFGGAGSQASESVLGDTNELVINFYEVVRDDLDDFVVAVEKLGPGTEEDEYYAVRALSPELMTDVEKAAWFYYLNQTCFNGIWRVNADGKFNVPFGRRKSGVVVDRDHFEAASELLQRTTLVAKGYHHLIRNFARPEDFWYLDPPYVPATPTASFTGYSKHGFDRFSQLQLAAGIRELTYIDAKVMLSNSDTPLTRELYANCGLLEPFITIDVRRSVSAAPGSRRMAAEIVATNYKL